MNRIGDEELWIFKDEVKSESDIWNADIPDKVKNALAVAWRDRMMQVTGRDEKGKPLYAPIWNFRGTTAWTSLSDGERADLEHLLARKDLANDELWKSQAEELLGALTKSVNMLACAEDLGSVPVCVPEVLKKLGILGLKVVRWERRWNEAGQPFVGVCDYPEDSVATTSVHDSSTMRGWWENENGARDFLSAWRDDVANLPEGSATRFLERYTPEVASFVLTTLARTTSSLFVLPAQDFLALEGEYYAANPDDERINVPGTVTAFNWTWRLPVPIEKLTKDKKLVQAIANALAERRGRAARKGASR